MPSFTALDTPQARGVRLPADLGTTQAHTVMCLHPGTRQAPGHGADARQHTARQDAVLQLISHALRRTDLVCELADGNMACVMAGRLGRERLSMLCWALLDALARLPQGACDASLSRLAHPSPRVAGPGASAGAAGGGHGPRASIGICSAADAGQGYAAMAQHAHTAMQRARLQQTGFAFFDSA